MSVRIICDSSCDLIPAMKDRVETVPLTVCFGDRVYTDGVDLTAADFYKKLAASSVMPTTSQASPALFEEVFQAAVDAGDEVVCICCSSRLSGTYQSATIGAADFSGKVFVVDSLNIAISASVMAQYALMLAEEGKSAAQIAAELEADREKIRLFAVVDTLEYLQRGGRISKAVALAGGMLAIKPIISLVDGKVEMVGKARGNKAANRLMNQQVETLGIDLTKPILLGYTGTDDSLLQKYMTECSGFWPEGTPATIVSGVVGTHAGPGAVACAFFTK